MSRQYHTIVYGKTGYGKTFALESLLYRQVLTATKTLLYHYVLNSTQMIVMEPQEPYHKRIPGAILPHGATANPCHTTGDTAALGSTGSLDPSTPQGYST